MAPLDLKEYNTRTAMKQVINKRENLHTVQGKVKLTFCSFNDTSPVMRIYTQAFRACRTPPAP